MFDRHHLLLSSVLTAAACGGSEAPAPAADDCAPYRSATPPTDDSGLPILLVGCEIDAPIPRIYAVQAQVGVLYQVQATGAPRLYIDRPHGKGPVYGTGARLSFLAWDSGTHLLQVSSGPEPGPTSTKLRLVVVPNPSDDHGDAISKATPLAVGGPELAGEIAVEGESDFFRVELAGGQRYNFHVAGSGAFDAPFAVLLDSGRPLLESTSHPIELDDILWAPPVGGTYFLRVGPSGSEKGTYQVAVTAHAGDDHPDSPAAATPIVFGQSIRGRIESSTDRDYFAVEVQAGQRIDYQMTRTPGVRLRVSGPRTLGSGGSGDGSRYSGYYAAEASGTVELEILTDDDKEQGRYELTVTSVE